MTALDRLIPNPRLREIDTVDLAGSASQVWSRVRHGDLARSPAIRALFRIRTLPSRASANGGTRSALAIDQLTSSPRAPGFQILADNPPREVAIGAIGKVWHLDIPFVHVGDAKEYGAFSEPGFIKVAWALCVSPLDGSSARLEVEVRVAATDDQSWRKFRRYFRLIGPASRFIRRSTLRALAREFGNAGDARRTA